MRTSAETESGAFVSLQAVGEFAGRLSLYDEIERPPAPAAGTAGTKTQDLTHVSVRDDRLTEVPEPSISRTASIVNKLALEAKTELEKLTNINKTVKEAVISKLCAIGELSLRLEETPLPQCGPAHTIIVTSDEKADTADQVTEKVRTAVDSRKRRVCVDRLRKTRDQKVIISCPTQKNIEKISGQLKERKGLKIRQAARKLPLVVIRDVRKENTDEDIVKSIRKQNKHATADLDWSSIEVKVKFRRRAKNDLECHPVLEVSPELWRRLVDAGYVYVGLQRRPVWDQSPQCTQCLGFGHTRKYCMGTAEKCARCGGEHKSQACEKRQNGEPPKCINCSRNKLDDTAHGAFSSECSVRNKWDALARARVSYA
ncbi:hypothetical protein EVAR_56570_1 [Eumeta japonica]|uniref:Nucleic-acid-binding protein from transposon X-element n=1 Tax=Eumeta variegata TaxID=151549 RepID=A0A4C1Z141_EUMVA|nr:hypothetical protein EVAR_56570_1 [Eumeta japonica]